MPDNSGGLKMAESGGDGKAGGDAPPFINYASQDAAFAVVLVEALGRDGIRRWIARRNVKGGALPAGPGRRAPHFGNRDDL
jgi:hypothetical protein